MEIPAVERHPDEEGDARGPGFVQDGALEFEGTGHGVEGAGEDREDTVALALVRWAVSPVSLNGL
jgi:hypothetical protein